FIGMARATPEIFQFSIKVPETITHVKRLDVNKGAILSFEEFLNKIFPLKTANKLYYSNFLRALLLRILRISNSF
ncbi:MAG: DUF72 domain-containing protein, partial [Candidatus Nitrosopolaris sp.]